MQAYSDATRENDPYALPDLEIFHISEQDRYTICEGNGEWHTQQCSTQSPCDDCPSVGWYWWSCFPGCLPNSDRNGPFSTSDEALSDARNEMED